MKTKKLSVLSALVALAAFGAFPSDASAAVQPFAVHNVFGDHMVVQRGKPVRVSGTAPAGVEIRCSWGREDQKVRADKDGNWVVEFAPRSGGGGTMVFGYQPWTMNGPQITLSDVAVGEVWVASGQSNMQFPVRALPEAKELVASLAKENDIRFLDVPRCSCETGPWPDFCSTAHWTKASDGRALNDASAVAVYFALALKRELAARKLGCPIGLVLGSWGGTPIEDWEYNRGCRWNAMLAPATEMNVRGAIWYQGCSNAANPDAYRSKQAKLIDEWSRAWRSDDFVFIITELASYYQDRPKNPHPADTYLSFGPDQAWNTIGYSPFRQMQTEFLDRPNVGVSPTFDIGEQSNLHPTNKIDVGRRLCREALRLAYGDKTLLPAPRFDAIRREGDALVVSFKDVGAGLEAVGGAFAPHLWAVKGETEDWTWAEACLRADNTVRLTAKGVAKPTGAQYAFMAYHANPNFRRKGDGLGVFSFRRTIPTAVKETVPLFDGSDTRRWYAFVKDVGKTAAVEGVLKDKTLVFDGSKIFAYTTINEFSDYVLEAEFKIDGEAKKPAIVVNAFGNKGIVENYALYGTRVPLSAGKKGEWASLKVVCRGASVEATVDGKSVLKATSEKDFGPIQLLSEGTPVSFRNVTLRPL